MTDERLKEIRQHEHAMREIYDDGHALHQVELKDLLAYVDELRAEMNNLLSKMMSEKISLAVQSAEKVPYTVAGELMVLRAENAKLRAALRYYADPVTYQIINGVLVMDDMGNLGDGTFDYGATAREALRGKEKP